MFDRYHNQLEYLSTYEKKFNNSMISKFYDTAIYKPYNKAYETYEPFIVNNKCMFMAML